MSDYDNTNKGAIWPNDKKITENHPDFTGSLNVNGQEFNVSAWKRKEGANPKSPSLRFAISEKESVAPKDYPKTENPTGGVMPTGEGFEIPF
jgi:hypothetical protein